VVTVVVATTEVVTPVEETTAEHMEVTTAAVISTVNDTSGIVVTTTVTPTDLGTTKIVALRVKIYFSLSSSTLATKSKTTLNLIANKALKLGKRFKVRVVGFTQPTKKDPNFKILAKNRAKVVATYLQSKGIKGIYSVLSGGQAPINAPTSRYSVVTVELITG
jgi:outer membrane protein OmpA-like peptidoglycan-associated protein